jgi:tetratricopeptide (TPR) repeat protein
MNNAGYSVRDVERVLLLSRSTIRGLIDVGFVRPARGSRREYRFSFQDLIVLRAARALIEAKVPRKRIRRSLEELRQHLPESMPLSGLSICAVGDRVVVREGKNHWQVDNGQYVLGLDVSVENGVLHVVDRKEQAKGAKSSEAKNAHDWFDEGLELEADDPRAASQAYRRAVGLDPGHIDAWTNLGRLLHELGELREAQNIYRRALKHCGTDSVLLFNLGVLLEDLGHIDQALEAYQTAVGEEPTLADCHYNLARLYESLGKTQHAIRHLGQYRRLVSTENH